MKWDLPRGKTVGFRLLAETFVAGATRVGGEMKKPGEKDCASLSLCRRTFKLKDNKKFRTWTKKSSSVFVFRDSYVLCIYVMNVPCTFRLFMYMAMVQYSGHSFGVVLPFCRDTVSIFCTVVDYPTTRHCLKNCHSFYSLAFPLQGTSGTFHFKLSGNCCLKEQHSGREPDNSFLPSKARTHFSRPCGSVHGSGWVCLGSGGSQSRFA